MTLSHAQRQHNQETMVRQRLETVGKVLTKDNLREQRTSLIRLVYNALGTTREELVLERYGPQIRMIDMILGDISENKSSAEVCS